VKRGLALALLLTLTLTVACSDSDPDPDARACDAVRILADLMSDSEKTEERVDAALATALARASEAVDPDVRNPAREMAKREKDGIDDIYAQLGALNRMSKACQSHT
jgi:hypothetical protein